MHEAPRNRSRCFARKIRSRVVPANPLLPLFRAGNSRLWIGARGDTLAKWPPRSHARSVRTRSSAPGSRPSRPLREAARPSASPRSPPRAGSRSSVARTAAGSSTRRASSAGGASRRSSRGGTFRTAAPSSPAPPFTTATTSTSASGCRGGSGSSASIAGRPSSPTSWRTAASGSACACRCGSTGAAVRSCSPCPPGEEVLNMGDDLELRETTCDPRHRRVLVTNGKTPAGQALVRAFAGAGAREVYVGNPDAWRASPELAALAELPGVTVFPLDVTGRTMRARARGPYRGQGRDPRQQRLSPAPGRDPGPQGRQHPAGGNGHQTISACCASPASSARSFAIAAPTGRLAPARGSTCSRSTRW